MIYLDNAATTPLLLNVKTYLIQLLDLYGNPSSIHSEGLKAKKLLEKSREDIAKCIHCDPDEIIFTSGGSESNNLALNTPIFDRYRLFLSTTIEHHSILNLPNNDRACSIPVNKDGIVDTKAFKMIAEYSCHPIISIMMVNNEIGTIQPIKKLVKLSRIYYPNQIFHVDAVQAAGHMPINVKDLGINMMSISGHKFGAPKGVGALYVERALQPNLLPIIYGGEQENGCRAGTENVLSIAAMAFALKYMYSQAPYYSKKIKAMQDYIIDYITNEIPNSHINGSLEHRIANNINACFDGVDAESLVLALDARGVCVSTRSACNSKDKKPSHVLTAIGLTGEQAMSSIRISLSMMNTMQQCEEAMDILKQTVQTLRQGTHEQISIYT